MKKSEETKIRILDAAIEVVAKKGYHGSSTKEIALKAGVAEGTLFKYYCNKEELLKSIVLRAMHEFQNFSISNAFPTIFEKTRGQSGEILIKEILKDRIGFFANNKALMKVIFQEILINDQVRESFAKDIWIKMNNMLKKIYTRSREYGEFREIKFEAFKKVIFGYLFYSVLFENILEIEGKETKMMANDIDEVINIIMNGIKEK